MTVKRYHPILVILHWLIALMLIVALMMGTFVLDPMPNSSPEKIDALKGHMIGGFVLLALMVLRFGVRSATKKPVRNTTGKPLADMLSFAVHYGFYVMVIGMAFSGMATSAAAGLPDIVFGGSGQPLPEDFFEFAPRIVHAIIAKLLMLMVVMHIVGAVYHQVILKDNLVSRMKPGKRE